MYLPTFALALLAALTSAAPSSLEARQGDSFVSVGNKYSGGGCSASTLIFADPIFGNGNVCQPLDRFGTSPPIVSYKTLSVSAGCSGEFENALILASFSNWSSANDEGTRDEKGGVNKTDRFASCALPDDGLYRNGVSGPRWWMCDGQQPVSEYLCYMYLKLWSMYFVASRPVRLQWQGSRLHRPLYKTQQRCSCVLLSESVITTITICPLHARFSTCQFSKHLPFVITRINRDLGVM